MPSKRSYTETEQPSDEERSRKKLARPTSSASEETVAVKAEPIESTTDDILWHKDDTSLHDDTSELKGEDEPSYIPFELETTDDKRFRLIRILQRCLRSPMLCNKLLAATILAVELADDDNIADAKIARVLSEVETFCEEISIQDSFSSLVNCHRFYTWIISIIVHLGLANNDTITAGIVQDQLRMAEALQEAVSSPILNDRIYGLRDEDANMFLNLLQEFLDRTGPFQYLHHPLAVGPSALTVRKLMIGLSRASGIFPSSFFIKRVKTSNKIQEIGSGAHADVYAGEYEDKPVALKKLRCFTGQQRDVCHKALCREALPWRQLRHPRIVLGVDIDTLNPNICMVSPLMQCGNVTEYVRRKGRGDVNMLQLMIDIADGLAYLHDQSIIHGDLRAANVFVDDSGCACISDFGLASFMDTMMVPTTDSGNPRWMAPELLSPVHTFRRTFATDIWSFGCSCFEIIAGEVPYADCQRDVSVMLLVAQGQCPGRPDSTSFPDTVSEDELWSFLMRCWSNIPDQRPTAETARASLHCLTNQLPTMQPRSMQECWNIVLECSSTTWYLTEGCGRIWK